MTRRSHKIAIAALFLLVLIAAIVFLSRAAAQNPDALPPPALEDCPADGKTLRAAEHFAQYCGGCHVAEQLAAAAQKTGDRDRAKAEMAAFLARHGSCSAPIDRAIADYLVDLRPSG